MAPAPDVTSLPRFRDAPALLSVALSLIVLTSTLGGAGAGSLLSRSLSDFPPPPLLPLRTRFHRCSCPRARPLRPACHAVQDVGPRAYAGRAPRRRL